MGRATDITALVLLTAAAAASVMLALHTRSRAIAAHETREAERAAAAAAAADTVRRATILFAGDLMVHTPMLTAARRYAADSDGFDFRPMFRHVAERFRRADYAVVNLETTLARGNYSGYPMFRSPAAAAEALADMGVDAAVTANNHCCDGGGRGIAATAEILDSLGIARTGTFVDSVDYRRNNPHRFKCHDISFALYSYTYGTNGLPVPRGRMVNLIDTALMARDLSAAPRDSVDVRIVFIHWGNEYERRENAHQRRLADFLRRHDADIIIGSHPHVIQPCEADSTHVTIYSLGNFISNQQWRYSDGGLMATIEVEKCRRRRPTYKAMLEPVWVMMPGYRLLPPEVGDTITLPPQLRNRYTEFISDTRRTLGAE